MMELAPLSSFFLRDGSPVPSLPGLALMCCPGKMQACSPKCCSQQGTRLALLTTSGCKGQRGRGHLPLTQVTSQQRGGRASSPSLCPQAWPGSLFSSTRALTTVLPTQGAGPILSNATAIEGQGHFIPLRQVAKGEGRGHPPRAISQQRLAESVLLPSCPGSAHLHPATRTGSIVLLRQVQGPLYQVLQLARGRTSFPKFMTLWAALLTARSVKGLQ